jgi:hypothetical protein
MKAGSARGPPANAQHHSADVAADAHPQAFHRSSSGSAGGIGDVLERVRSLQQRAGSVLEAVRSLQRPGALASSDGFDSAGTDAMIQNFTSIELELQDIKTRRHARSDALLKASRSGINDCPYCKKPIPEEKLDSHPRKCAMRPTRCSDCGREMTARELEAHKTDGSCNGGSLLRRTDSFGSNTSGSSFASINSPPSSSTPTLLSSRQREKLRVQEILRQQEEERRATPSSSGTMTPKPGAEPQMVACVHCGKMAPSSHPPRCAHRIVECKHCHEKVAARDAVKHAQICKLRRKK